MSEQTTYRTQSNWSMEDIARYHEEKMTSAELKAFREDMQKDPFLREAVEGYEGHALLYVNQHLDKLKEKYRPESKSISMRFLLPLVAAVLLLTAFWFLMDRGEERSTIASRMDNNQAAVVQNNQKKSAPDAAKSSPTPESKHESAEGAAYVAENEAERSMSFDIQGDSNTIQAKPGIRYKGIEAQRTRRSFNAPIYTGIVKNDLGEPVGGAMLHFLKNDAKATTDFQGRFAVQLRFKEDSIIVNHQVYDPVVIQPGRIRTGLEIELEPTQLVVAEPIELLEQEEQDLIVTSVPSSEPVMRSERKEATDAGYFDFNIEKDENPSPVVPKIGFNRYDRYIKRNLKYPTIARLNGISGEVKVRFDILTDGRLTNLAVIESLGYGCDAEAIRLIKEGPDWQTDPPGLKSHTTFTIKFPQDP